MSLTVVTLGVVKGLVHTPDGLVSQRDGIDREQSLRTLQVVIIIILLWDNEFFDQNLGIKQQVQFLH